MKLESKKILITGASSGIGKAVALRCAKDNCHIILASRNFDKLDSVKEEIEKIGSTATVMVTDVTDHNQVKELFLKSVEDGKPLDVVLNNAGLGHIANIYDQKVEDIESMVDVNLKGMIYVAKYATEVMTRQKSGHLIFTSSLAGLTTVPQWATYNATKWGITGFSDTLRLELKPFGISVTSIHPGFVNTEFFAKDKANLNESALEKGFAVSVDYVADMIYKSIFTKRKKVVIPPTMRLFTFLNKYLPGLATVVYRLLSTQDLAPNVGEDEPEFDK